METGLEDEGIEAVLLHQVGGPQVDLGIFGPGFGNFPDKGAVPGRFLAGGFVAIADAVAGAAAVDASLARLGPPVGGRRRHLDDRLGQTADAGPLPEVRLFPTGHVFVFHHQPGLNQGLGVRHRDGAGSKDADRFQVLGSPDGAEPSLAGSVAGVMNQGRMGRPVFACRTDGQNRRLLGGLPLVLLCAVMEIAQVLPPLAGPRPGPDASAGFPAGSSRCPSPRGVRRRGIPPGRCGCPPRPARRPHR